MSKIVNITTDLFRIPLPVTLTDATHGEMKEFDLITVQIRDSEGAEGIGYTYVGQSSATPICEIIESYKDLLIAEDADRIEYLWQKMWWELHYSGRGGPVSFAISVIDIALWDLKSRKQNQPLWKFLGGHDPKVQAYAGGIDLYFTIDELLDQTQRNLNNGFRAIKMKVGRKHLSEDVERVTAMREFLGADFPLMVDANMGWRTDEAIGAARALSKYQIYWLEEPTIPDDFSGYGRIHKEGGVPIAAGENLHTLYEFQHLIEADGVAFLEPDVTNCGGITTWMKIAHVGEANNLPVTSHGVHDLQVHLLAAVSNKSYLEVHGFGLQDYIANPVKVVEGYATAPDRIGHGVSFDWNSLDKYRVQQTY